MLYSNGACLPFYVSYSRRVLGPIFMNYQTFEPATMLAPFIQCYWTLESAADALPQRQTIVPDGCMEMIFHYGDLYRQYTGADSWLLQPACFVIGQLTQPLVIEPTGKTAIFAVRFRPDGFRPFTAMPFKEMDNRAVALGDLFGAAGIAIGQGICAPVSTTERIALVETFLSALLTDTVTIDHIVKETVSLVLAVKGKLDVAELSARADLHRRQLERRFAAAIGLSPKQLSKTIRLQHVLKRLLDGQFETLTTLAHEGDYYDQAHFIRDFKAFTGVSPKAFFGAQLKLSGLFYKEK